MKDRLSFILFTLVPIVVLLGMATISEQYVRRTVERERAANISFLGEAAERAEQRAWNWFEALFVRTQLVEMSLLNRTAEQAATPAPVKPRRQDARPADPSLVTGPTDGPDAITGKTARLDGLESRVDGAASAGLAWWTGRVRVTWMMSYQVLVRSAIVLSWLPLALLVLTPILIDAMVVRKIKATNFSITSPHMALIGMRALLLLVILLVVLQLLPLMLHPVVTPVILTVFSMSAWISITQFAKRA